MSAKRRAASRPTVHVSIDVPSLEEGLRFYGGVFGFVETARPFPTMAILDANNLTVCLHEKAAKTRSSSAGAARRRYDRHWTPVHLDLHVRDFDAVLETVRAQGGSVELELRDKGPKPVGFCSDPFGNGFCVIGERIRARSGASPLHPDIQAHNAAQKGEARAVCATLAGQICGGLRGAESKIWHGGPVLFLEGNPIVGYWVRKACVELLFWSGQSFTKPGLEAAGKFKAARFQITAAKQLEARTLGRWLREARRIQWDYKNIVKRRGVLAKLGSW